MPTPDARADLSRRSHAAVGPCDDSPGSDRHVCQGPIELESTSPQQTEAIGAALAELLAPGDVLALCGPLGTGKTVLIRGIAHGLGVPLDEPVLSPTFVLVREHQGRLPLLHCDAYRLRDPRELIDLGLEELRRERGVVIAIEWADRFPELVPPDAIRIELEHVDPQTRRVRIHIGEAARAARVAKRLAAG